MVVVHSMCLFVRPFPGQTNRHMESLSIIGLLELGSLRNFKFDKNEGKKLKTKFLDGKLNADISRITSDISAMPPKIYCMSLIVETTIQKHLLDQGTI